jgi:hypothetical protein
MLSLPPTPDETIQAWCSRVFRDLPYAIIVNKAEGWSRELANAIHGLFLPLQAVLLGEFELEITLFIGNYGYTPFGFHVDDGDTSVIHLHFGPSSKTMYVLEVDKFQQAMPADTRRSFDFDVLTRIAEEFTIDAGDIFVLPSTKYHTGYSPEYSVAVAVAVIRSSAIRTDMDAIKNGAAELLGLPLDLSLGDALTRLRSRATGARRSAGGFQLPLPRQKVLWDEDSILSASVQLPMQVVYEGAVLLIYAGGHEISLRNHAALGPLIEILSRLREKPVRDLVLEHPAVAPLAIHELVDILVQTGSLEVTSHGPRCRESL